MPSVKIISALSLSACLLTASSPIEWAKWKNENRKVYKSIKEDSLRYNIFVDNIKTIEEHNQKYENGESTYFLGLTKFADLTHQEFLDSYTVPVRDPLLGKQFDCPEQFNETVTPLPSYYDWRFASDNDLNLVAVTEVKDQGSCGSCWTFGANAAMEGSLCMKNVYDCSTWNGLSEQNLVDCASQNQTFLGVYDNHGCGGGEQSNAIRWAWLAGGISDSDDYPYVSGTTRTEGECQQPPFAGSVSDAICGTTSYNGASEELLASAIIKRGPVTIGIDAGGVAFSLYSGGVYSSTTCSGRRINHAVTTVGFGVSKGDSSEDMKYWTIKNSWGSGWGIEGYILVERGVDMCGVERDTQYALMVDSNN